MCIRDRRVDTTPLRTSPDFRRLFLAGTVFYLGGMVSYVALPWQLYHLTGSNLAVGLLGVVELVPLVAFGLWGGALADHVDRRLMLVWTGVAQAVLTAVLMLNVWPPEPRAWVIYAVGAVLSAAGALQRPSREALIPARSAITSFQLPCRCPRWAPKSGCSRVRRWAAYSSNPSAPQRHTRSTSWGW